ncbi:mechanosensitive ion channel family protein [Alginatibacterium sediminis]|uniref:Small-conductance mechanosensitive channel n=2 Tax=Alginatibacterium sediminis TaxID=2164068 RepID=A0A420EIJ6_9ALTE|nr:mechanosensitive ion channel family protein [Alginatibacterium sediminis]
MNAFGTVNLIVDEIVKAEQAGSDVAEFKQSIVELIQKRMYVLDKEIKEQQQSFIKEQAELEPKSTAALLSYMHFLSQQDLVYSTSTNAVLDLETLGVAPETAKEGLIDKLYQRSEGFAGLVILVGNQQDELNRMLRITPTDQSLKDQLAVVTEQLKIAGESFKLSVELLTNLGFDADFYQSIILKLGGQLTTEILDPAVLSNMALRAWSVIVDYFSENGGEWVFKLLIITAIFYISRTLSRVFRRFLTKSLDRSNLRLSSLMKEMIISSASRFIMVIGLFIALAQIGISLAPILAGLGVAGFIVGFALQDTLSNFAAGMMILIYRPYDVGDVVEVAGVFGKVKSMNLVSTTILTFDNQTLVIPNSKIWGDVIKNVTAQQLRRVDLVFGIGYGDDIEKAERVLAELVNGHKCVLQSPAPTIKVNTLNESSVDFIVRPWVRTEDYWDVYWDLTKQVKLRFDLEQISIPFPQRDLHIIKELD